MVKDWIRGLFRQDTAQDVDVLVSEIAPDERFISVGDIHGRLDLLQSLLARLDDDCPLIFVGDYVDRGDYSAQVLRQLHHLSKSSDGRVVCLLGNHEEMLLRFVENPKWAARLWLHNGGVRTLASFGVKGTSEAAVGDDAIAIADQLQRAMGDELLTWLADRPLTWTSGNVTVVHAALDPQQPVQDQARQNCLWGHPMFPSQPRQDGQWVVHGHTIVGHAQAKNGIVSIDTGAFATNRLTAAEIFKGGVRFTSTG
ncbi:metallophosphoesterase [Rhodobacteraceae bacterium B1Z28]|uniref:Metallophosphoesterase n=1 Tax=Ruegeria haliotis TaxID=2747601 RepID=A0ABX2PR79_9RHOB|nr:metallophosphoesterase [Ruegeria haliotis]NVO56255.1 metallophosphoesterase [Ruegeria haliotis]